MIRPTVLAGPLL